MGGVLNGESDEHSGQSSDEDIHISEPPAFHQIPSENCIPDTFTGSAREMSCYYHLRQRETTPYRFRERRPTPSLLSAIQPWGEPRPAEAQVFNLQFTLDGHLLLAVCEDTTLRFYDPRRPDIVFKSHNAHENCINVARFIDDYRFLTGSDDTTVRMFDLRMLYASSMNAAVRIFRGHVAWVKNVDLCSHGNGRLFISSSFDGTVRLWDLDGPDTGVPVHPNGSNILLAERSISRTRLALNGTKIVVAMTTQSTVVVHDVNWDTLAADMEHVALSKCYHFANSTTASELPEMFVRSHNRVEVLDDPIMGYATSVQLSADGRYLLCRKHSNVDSEALVVHDLVDDGNCRKGIRKALFAMTDSAAGRGYIKGPSFSSCGQLIASPYYHGVRMFNFAKGLKKREEEGAAGPLPLPLAKAFINTHTHPVLTTRWSPAGIPLLASGGCDKRVVFYCPQL